MDENSLTPGVLVAMPSLKGPYFEKSVILLCNYDETGAFGLVVNRPSSFKVKEVLADELKEHQAFDVPLLVGGPVQPDSFWAVHDTGFKSETTTELSEGVALSAAQDVLLALSNGDGPKDYHLGCGYSGWGDGQLDQEILEESWWLAPLDEPLVLKDSYSERWENIMQTLGMDPLTVSLFKTGTV